MLLVERLLLSLSLFVVVDRVEVESPITVVENSHPLQKGKRRKKEIYKKSWNPSGFCIFPSTPGNGHAFANCATSSRIARTVFHPSRVSPSFGAVLATRTKSLRSLPPASFWSWRASWMERCRKSATTSKSFSRKLREVRAEVPRRIP